ncbi:uncharacterized protein LOC116165137 [Photinus pyralis]|uniref:Myb/SANT-like DNA-binding domain-containing protein n=1 Tax=Photinus pyralis TaxID=7054 RepID=A0A1Y1LVT6_PHOPY|nr:uncharacterized protein LOC116165137 [Photinus pyralis]
MLKVQINGKILQWNEDTLVVQRFNNDDQFAQEFITQIVKNGKLIQFGISPKDIVQFSRIIEENSSPLQEDVDAEQSEEFKEQSPTPSGDSGKKWTEERAILLVTKRLDEERDFINPKCKKNKLWNDIARQMTNVCGIEFTGTECDNKYRNLLYT